MSASEYSIKTYTIKEKKQIFTNNILSWRKENWRNYPWRTSHDPYNVLVAEVMLQRTQADQVVGIYLNFIKKFPDIKSASKADLNILKKFLESLGLKQRNTRFAKLLTELACIYNGKIPDTKEELLKISGIGPYIASAILSFGFRRDNAIVDSNVVRILKRVFGFRSKKKRLHTDIKIWQFAEELIPLSKGPEYNEGLLDFSALICKQKPICDKCPISFICNYHLEENVGYI